MPKTDKIPPDKTNRPALRLPRAVLAGYWLVLVLLTHWPGLALYAGPPLAPDDPWTLVQADKLAHLVAFGGLALLLVLARPLGPGRSPNANRLAAGLIALVYAGIDEATQGLVADRSVTASDLLANLTGIVGVLVLALSPRRTDTAPPTQSPSGKRSLAFGLGLLVVGGGVLAITRTTGQQSDAVHFFAVAALTATLLRRHHPVPARPRLSTGLICAGVGLTLVLGEIAQGFLGMVFARSEVFYGAAGLLLVMAGWSLRLVFGPPTPTATATAVPQRATPNPEASRPPRP